MTSNGRIDVTYSFLYAEAMQRSAFTLRLPEAERMALETLSKVEGRPMNYLLNEAVKEYLSRSGPRERSLEENLARLRAYRERDPEFKSAIASFVDAEVNFPDPVEGVVVRSGRAGRKLTAVPHVGKRVREKASA